MPHRKIAAIVNVPVGVVMSRLAHGRAMLRAAWLKADHTVVLAVEWRLAPLLKTQSSGGSRRLHGFHQFILWSGINRGPANLFPKGLHGKLAMIMKADLLRGVVFGGLLGFLTGVAVLAAPARAEDMAVKIRNFNVAAQSVTMKAINTVTRTNADNLRHAVTSTTRAIEPKTLDTEYDSGVICETQKQAERLAMLLDGNEDAAVATVNAEERDPSACSVETIAFVRGASIATARSRGDTFAVIEVLVVGVDNGGGFQRIAPGAYFMLVKIDERDA